MKRLGPFEPAPRLAVAVSGGADSLALAVLAAAWARPRGGSVTALTVDHGLRPEAAAEARYVRRTLAPLGIGQRTLRWHGPKPGSNIQATARRARYELLNGWCESHGVLHLLLAHNLGDQAETLLLRLGRGSGLDGLAAMAALSETPGLRLLRPLLGVPKDRLKATLSRRRIAWVEDPSNLDLAFGRVKIRALLPALAAEGLTPARLAATAGALGRARNALDQEVARLLVRTAIVHPAGFASLDPAALAAAPEETGLRALARLLVTMGGLDYAPRLERLERLYGRIRAGLGRGATLGGCRIIPRRGRLLVVREAARAADCALRAGARVHWDGRFEIAVRPGARTRRGTLVLGALGQAGWAELIGAYPEGRGSPIPLPARYALPALRDSRGLVAVPHLGYTRRGTAGGALKYCRFAPKSGLASVPFTVA
jgi:tRNA(Ile)-lysidine synthase